MLIKFPILTEVNPSPHILFLWYLFQYSPFEKSLCTGYHSYIRFTLLTLPLKCAVVSLYSVVKQRLKCNTGKVCNCLIQIYSLWFVDITSNTFYKCTATFRTHCIILQSTPKALKVVSILQFPPTTLCLHHFSLPFVLHPPPTPISLIQQPQCLVPSTNPKATHYAISFSPVTSSFLGLIYLTRHPIFKKFPLLFFL
jgi:hypothetical protein